MAVQPDPIPSSPIPLPDSIHVDVMVFPRETEGERGLYHDTVITLVKELRKRRRYRELSAPAGVAGVDW